MTDHSTEWINNINEILKINTLLDQALVNQQEEDIIKLSKKLKSERSKTKKNWKRFKKNKNRNLGDKIEK